MNRRIWLATVVSALLLTSWAAPARAAEPLPESDQSLLETIREQQKLPGLAGAAVRDGKLVYLAATGLRKVDAPEPLLATDRVHLGSCTKSMTATLIARLIEKKLLRWDSTIAELFPEDQLLIDESWHPITIVDLLVHRSGAEANARVKGFDPKDTPAKQRSIYARELMRKPLAGKHREQYLYSNTGYILAGAIAEKVTGKGWEELMWQEVFEPLGIKEAGFGPQNKVGTDQPFGHRQEDEKLKATDHDNPVVLGPAGRVSMALGDWAKYIAAHLAGARGDESFLSKSSWQRLHTIEHPQDEYALGHGVFHRGWAGGRVLTHSGSNTFWYAIVWMAPETNFAVMAVTNVAGDQAAAGCDEVCSQLIQRFAPPVTDRSTRILWNTRKTEDRLDFTEENSATSLLTITSKSGIGSAKVQLSSGAWKEDLRLRFRYTDGRPFQVLEGIKLTLPQQIIAGDIKTESQTLERRTFDDAGKIDDKVAEKVELPVRRTKEYLELTIPRGLLGPHDALEIEWIDWYR